MRKNIIWSYERHSLIMNRIAQLENNSPSTLDEESITKLNLERCNGFFEKAEKIAEEELRQGLLPFKINRPTSTNEYEQWKIEDMVDINR